MINVYLDDLRPCPDGWVYAQTIEQVKHYLKLGIVDRLSLDHDLGACADCFKVAGVEYTGDYAKDWAAWVAHHTGQAAPNCEHIGTGYNLVCWMAEHGIWSKQKPTVHSANPEGRRNMIAVIERYFGTSPTNGWKKAEV